jgi:hypothetical protein
MSKSLAILLPDFPCSFCLHLHRLSLDLLRVLLFTVLGKPATINCFPRLGLVYIKQLAIVSFTCFSTAVHHEVLYGVNRPLRFYSSYPGFK